MPGSAASPTSDGPTFARRFPIGAEYAAGDRAHVRVWAPAAHRVDVVVGTEQSGLQPEGDGYFSGAIDVKPGDTYQFRINEAEQLYPDPASRFQPDGPHGPSAIIDPAAFEWTDSAWRGATMAGQVVYEMHVGTFTREGSWAAAMREIDELARLGITMIEVMPVADFNGKFGWGYDGVNLFAPTRLYGRPDDFRRFVSEPFVAAVRSQRLGIVGNSIVT